MNPRLFWGLAIPLLFPLPLLHAEPPVPPEVRQYLGGGEIFVSGDRRIAAFAAPGWQEEARRAETVARQSLEPLAAALGVRPDAVLPVRIVVAPDVGRLHLEAPSWSAAVARPGAHLIVLSGPALHEARMNLRETVAHELVHLILHARIGELGWMPLWLHEGLAVEASGYGRWSDRLITWGRGPVHLRELTDAFPPQPERARLAYLESQAAVRRLLRRGSIEPLLSRVAAGEEFATAFEAVYGETPESFADAVSAEVEKHWRFMPLLTSGTSVFGLMTALLFLAAWRKRVQRRRRLAAWAEAEAGEERGGSDLP